MRKCLEMANLPIPAEVRAKSKEEEAKAAALQPKAEAKAKAAASKTNASSSSGQLAKRLTAATSAVVTPQAGRTGIEAAVLPMQQPMQLAYPQVPTTAGMASCSLATVPPAGYAAAPGYSTLCAVPADPSAAGYPQLCGVPGDASTAVLQLQYARYAAALQFQSAYAVGGAAMLSNVANAGQCSTGLQQMQTLQQNMYSMAAGEPPRRRTADRRPREPHDPERRFIGTITKWDDDAGFGFISSWDAYKVYGKDVFVHKAQIGLIGGASAMYAKRRRSEIRNGDTVSYTVDLAENPGKPRAYNVEKLAAPPEGPNPISGEAELAKRRRLEAERQT